jgi:hypothetical protein
MPQDLKRANSRIVITEYGAHGNSPVHWVLMIRDLGTGHDDVVLITSDADALFDTVHRILRLGDTYHAMRERVS